MSAQDELSIPDDLIAHALWSPPEYETKHGGSGAPESDEGPNPARVVYVSERRLRRISMWMPLIPLGFYALTLIIHIGLPFADYYPLAILAIVALASVAVGRSGRAGFYAVAANGDLGEHFGRLRPDLAGLQRTRINNKKPRRST